uniref:Tubulin beta chain n=1 Tax=Lygus hesperus TaxID=30085 RepID=A0A0A9YZ44_LYGHE
MTGVVGVHVGQGGVGAGEAMWDLLRREHGIMDSGYIHRGNSPNEAATSPNVMFQAQSPEKYYQKAVFMDTDPNTMDNVVSGPQGRLLQRGAAVSGREAANGLYSCAKRQSGPEMGPTVVENVRKLTEKENGAPEGFLFTHSMAGGTGSGLTADMLGRLKEEYPKSHQLQLAVFPEKELKSKDSLFGFYNAALMLKDTLDDPRTVILVDNPALLGILNSCSLKPINGNSYRSANQLLAHVASALTACTRFYGTSPILLEDLEAFLVPTNLLRFSSPAINPISQGCYCHGVQPEKMETRDVTTGCFDPRAQLNSATGVKGEPVISSSLVYRGKNDKDEINRSIHQAVNQYDVRFGEGIQKGFKVGLAETAPSLVPFQEHKKANTSAALFLNTTALAVPFSFLKEVIQAMLDRRTNLHYYLENGEEPNDFSQAQDSLQSLLDEYKSYRGQNPCKDRNQVGDPIQVGERENKRNWNYTHGVQELRQYACKCYRCYEDRPCPTR